MSQSKKTQNIRPLLPNIDFELGKQLVGGDAELAEAALSKLMETLLDDSKRAEVALNQNDNQELGSIIYSILDQISHCGVPRLKNATTDLYQHLKSGVDKEKIKSLFLEFQLAVLSLILEHWRCFSVPKLSEKCKRILG